MKKIFSFAVIFCLLLFCVPLSTACAPETPLHEKIDLTIKNYSNYDGLSIGFQNQTMQGMSLLSNESEETVNSKLKLLGKHKDGYYEEIQFEEEHDGEIITTQYNIHAVQDVGPFLFVGYTNNPIITALSSTINNTYNNDYLYLIDKVSGKMFDFTEHKINLSTMGVYCASENTLFALSMSSEIVLKVYIKNAELCIEELFEPSKLLNFQYPIITDKYNNLYSTPASDSNECYMISAQGELKQLTNAKLAANNIMYVDNQWINERGELEEASFVPTNFVNLKTKEFGYAANNNFIFKENNVEYYRKTSGNIIKYTFTNNIEYNVEEIIIPTSLQQKNGLASSKKLYFLDETSILYIDVTNGNTTTITSHYFFNKLYLNAENELIFEALDSSLNDVKGIINPDDTIEVGITQKDFKIYFIAPIN